MADWSPTTEYHGNGDEHLGEELLTEYIDGQVRDADTLARIRQHLAGCSHCRQELNDLRTVVSLLGDLPVPEPSRSFRLAREMTPVRVMRADPWYLRMQPAMRRMAAVAAVLLVCVVAVDLLISTPEPTDTVVWDAAPAAGEVDSPEGASAMRAREALPEAYDDAVSAADSAESEIANDQDAAYMEDAAPESAQAQEAVPEANDESALALAETDTAEPSAPGTGIDQTAEIMADDPSMLSLLQFALALLVAWLLVMTVALPRLRPSDRDIN